METAILWRPLVHTGASRLLMNPGVPQAKPRAPAREATYPSEAPEAMLPYSRFRSRMIGSFRPPPEHCPLHSIPPVP